MPDNKQIVRQLDILRTLLARQTYGTTYQKLADESGVSERTISRFTTQAQNLHLPQHWV